MNKLPGCFLTLVLLAPASLVYSDTGRSYGSGDISRESQSADTGRHSEHSGATPGVDSRMIGPGPRKLADQPPKYGYWSTKCIKQRSSSFSPWNHSKDCDHPAYSRGYRPGPYGSPYGFGQPVIIINNYNGARYRR